MNDGDGGQASADETERDETGRGDADRGDAGRAGAEIDPKLLELLVCPLTKEALHYDRERQELVSKAARLAFPIRDGISIMLVDEARSLDD